MGDRECGRTFFGKEYTPPSISALILGALARTPRRTPGRPVHRGGDHRARPTSACWRRTPPARPGRSPASRSSGSSPSRSPRRCTTGSPAAADGTTFLVYDLGGGTFDISLIKMTETSVEVLAVGGNHRLGGADWDEKLFDHLVEQLIAQCGDDSVARRRGGAAGAAHAGRADQEGAVQGREPRRSSAATPGRRPSITVTRAAVRGDDRGPAGGDHPDHQPDAGRGRAASTPASASQISELLLVGGSSRMPAVAERLSKEFRWEPRLADPDLAVAKGAALYAAGQTVRFVEPGRPARRGQAAHRGRPRQRRRPWRPRPGDRRGGAGGGRPDRHRRGEVRELAQRRSSTCCPRPSASSCSTPPSRTGRTILTARPTSSTSSHAQTQLPCQRRHVRRQDRRPQPAGDRDRDLGAGRRRPQPGPGGQPPGGRQRA